MSVQFDERRSAERVPCRVLVHHVEGNDLQLYETIEISETGCLLRARSAGRPSPGAEVCLPLQLPGVARELKVSGVVVGEAGERSEVFALALRDLAPATVATLRAFVAEARYAQAARVAVTSHGGQAARTA